MIAIRLLTAEKTPKSPTDNPLAIIKVNKKPRKAEATFPANRTYVSFADWDFASPTALSI